jgi:tyrosyl-tRNA synthetase
MKFQSAFLNTLSERGYIHQCSDESGIDALAKSNSLVVYIGFDCTARSLHVGSLVQIMLLHWAQQTGQKVIALMGGGTTRVGDPSFRDETRRLLSVEEIEENKRGIQDVFAKFLHFGTGDKDAIMVDNAEWLVKLNYLDMLRDIGRHFSVNRMMAMDSVKLRFEREQELSFLEFNYMILQAYDYVELARRYGCNLQSGGSDQWGNIINGIDLGRRMGTHQLYALTTPLITLASGAKMGKTATGAVWLNADMCSPYEYWQFWRNTEDADVGRFLRLFTTLPLDEITELTSSSGAEINKAKKKLADEATTMLHGKDAAETAAETARRTFEEGAVAEGLPTKPVARSDIEGGLGVLKAVVLAGLASSNGEVRRAIANNAIQVNDARVIDEKQLITINDFGTNGILKLSMGRKKHVLLKIAG